MTENTMEYLKAQVVKRLSGVASLSQITVIVEDKKDIVTEINKALAQGSGALLTVSTGDEESEGKALSPPQATIELVVECAETPALNRGEAGTNVTAIDMAHLVTKALHLYQWSSQSPLVWLRTKSMGSMGSIIVYSVVFQTSIVINPKL